MSIIEYPRLLTNALAFTAAIAWNNSVSGIITSYVPKHPVLAGAIYAIIITLIVIVIAFMLNTVSFCAQKIASKFTQNTNIAPSNVIVPYSSLFGL